VIDDVDVIPYGSMLYVRVGENVERINSLKVALSRGQTRKKSLEILVCRVDVIVIRECTRVRNIYKINLKLSIKKGYKHKYHYQEGFFEDRI